MNTIKERRKAKALKRSQINSPKKKAEHISFGALARREVYRQAQKRREIMFRKFAI